MAKSHPAEERTNRYPARCAKCGNMVKAGEGVTAKVMGTTERLMIVKVQISLSKPPMALVYDEKQTVQGQFPASGLPRKVKMAVKRNGGKAYFHAEVCGNLMDFDDEVSGLMVDW